MQEGDATGSHVFAAVRSDRRGSWNLPPPPSPPPPPPRPNRRVSIGRLLALRFQCQVLMLQILDC